MGAVTEVGIVGRLKAAGFLPLAERVAARCDLMIKHIVAPGAEPTRGHVALWTALHAEGQSAAQIAALVDWPEAEIRKALPAKPPPSPKIPEPRPTPPPKSGVREVRDTPGDGPAGDIVRQEALKAGVRVADLHPTGARSTRTVAAVRAAIAVRLTDELRWSQPEIGRFLGVDHTTVGHYLKHHRRAA